MKTKIPAVEKLTIGRDLLDSMPVARAPSASLRAAPCGATISALPRSVGDRRRHVGVLDDTGEILAEEVIVITREVLTAFCARYPARPSLWRPSFAEGFAGLAVNIGQTPLAFRGARTRISTMTRVQEIRQRASALSPGEKAELAADLLESLPPILDDDDEGVAEARGRDQELSSDPTTSITWDQLRHGLGR